MKRILSIALGIFLFVSCTSTGIEKTEHGIIVRLQPENSRGVRNIRLQVVNEKIIHVSATSEKSFSTEKSLITKPGLTFSDRFTVEEKRTGSFSPPIPWMQSSCWKQVKSLF